jgi:glycosyltransferase involved in cell wall biosynthesis/nucleoside-diphosphate-sugar epimerase
MNVSARSTPGAPIVAVIGASGFVGGAVVAELTRRGVDVRRVSAPRLSSHGRSASEMLACAEACEDETASLRERFTGCSTVINAAGMAAPDCDDTDAVFGANALLPALVVRAARDAGVQRTLHVSTTAVLGRNPITEQADVDPLTPYARSKAVGERVALAGKHRGDRQVVVVRPASVHGKGRQTTQRLARACRSPLASVAGSGTGATPQTHVDDLARALATLADLTLSPPEIVVVPDSGYSAAELIRVLGNREPIHLPTALVRAVLGVGHMLAITPRWKAAIRRLELYWCGQSTADPLWLTTRGFVPASDRLSWQQLATDRPGERRVRIMFAVTVPFTAHTLLRGQLAFLRESGFDVTLVCSPGAQLTEVESREGVRVIAVPMRRKISVRSDLTAFRQIRSVIGDERPDIVHGSSPKAALLSLLAARTSRVPRRIYLLRGLRLEAETPASLRWRILSASERLTAGCATEVLCVGNSLLDRALELGLFPAEKAKVLGLGSSNGVDCERFFPASPERREAVRTDFGLGNEPVIGFVGRVCYDKGVDTLVEAFLSIRARRHVKLLIVGGELEEERPVTAQTLHTIRTHPDIVWLGLVSDTAPCYHAMDVLALPSLREGFPNVVLEAAASGVPAVVRRSTGSVDAVQPGTTGLVVDTPQPEELAAALETLLEDAQHTAFSSAAREFVTTYYSRDRVWADLADYLGRPDTVGAG